MNDTPPVIKYSWEEVRQMSGRVASLVKESGFVPDVLIGITVGGLVPLAIIAKDLQIKTVRTISASSYSGHKQHSLAVHNMPAEDFSGKKILLIDELADTCVTIGHIRDRLLKEHSGAEVKTAALVVNTEHAQFEPDFVAEHDAGWFVFPWEEADFPQYF